MNAQCENSLIVSPYYYKIDVNGFKIYHDEISNILVYEHVDQQIMFFQTLSDMSIFPKQLSTPITFIPKGPILSVCFSIDRRFIAIIRSATNIEVFNLIDPKHNCITINLRSKEPIIPNGLCWLHTKKEAKDQVVFSPILAIATAKTLSFYDVTLKGTLFLKTVKINVSFLRCNRLNQLVVAVDAASSRAYVYTVKELVVTKLQTLTLSEPPTQENTFLSTLYRATYLYQYSESRGHLFIYAFSNRDNDFKYYNTIALPYAGKAIFTVSDHLIIVHYPELKKSCMIDIADVPFDATCNKSIPLVSREAVSSLHLYRADELPEEATVERAAIARDPSFQQLEEVRIPYRSYEVQITSSSIGLELESTFQKLFVSPLDGRLHGCLDNSGFVKGFSPTISPIVRSQVEIGSYITHVDDQMVIGNTFANLLQLLSPAKRPIRIRFERGIPEEDSFLYRGATPIQGIVQLGGENGWKGSIYDPTLLHLPNNVLVDRTTGSLLALRLLLPSEETATVNRVRSLLRRRSRIPVFANGEWNVEDTEISKYPRELLKDILKAFIPRALETGQLAKLFEVLNKDYASLSRRAWGTKEPFVRGSKELQVYLTQSSGKTRELNGNIVITQMEMLNEVLMPLSETVPNTTHQLVLLTYLQSLVYAKIPVEAGYNQYLREALLHVSGAKATAALLNLTRSGLLEQDVVGARKTLSQSSNDSDVATELAMQTLRKNGDYESLLNFFHSKQRLGDMLQLMAKNHEEMKEEMNLWILNVINLANILYEETAESKHLYSVYHFISRYNSEFLEDVQYPNRLGGLLEFAEDDSTENDDKISDGTALPTKGRSMKRILQTVKETIVRRTFS